jgi:UDP-glucose 4-epimerase
MRFFEKKARKKLLLIYAVLVTPPRTQINETSLRAFFQKALLPCRRMTQKSEPYVFVSGAAGYIGGAIVRELAASSVPVHGGIRRVAPLPPGVVPIVTGDLSTAAPDLSGAAAVVHAAGLGHRRGVAPSVWRAANIDAAKSLARAAAAAGVRKFVLMSTAHIHGRVHVGVVTDTTAPNPMDDYAASKLEAERAVAAIFGAGLTVVRPVAVIGPHCPGNLQLLMKLLDRRAPLPFASIANQRSFIAADDLARLVNVILQTPSSPPAILAAHPDAISTPDLIRALATGMNIAPLMLPFPPSILAFAARLASRPAMFQSFAGSFIANPQAALALGWRAAETLTESLQKTGAAYVVS